MFRCLTERFGEACLYLHRIDEPAGRVTRSFLAHWGHFARGILANCRRVILNEQGQSHSLLYPAKAYWAPVIIVRVFYLRLVPQYGHIPVLKTSAQAPPGLLQPPDQGLVLKSLIVGKTTKKQEPRDAAESVGEQ